MTENTAAQARRTASAAVIATALLFVWPPPDARSQSPDASTSLPIEIEIGPSSPNPVGSGRLVDLTLRNVSGQGIAAYALQIQGLDAAGEPLPIRSYHLEIPGLGPPSAPAVIPAGRVWTKTIPAPADRFEVSLDYAQRVSETGGLSEWGPDNGRQSQQVRAARSAYRMERSRLRRLYEREGVEALLEDLTTQAPAERPGC